MPSYGSSSMPGVPKEDVDQTVYPHQYIGSEIFETAEEAWADFWPKMQAAFERWPCDTGWMRVKPTQSSGKDFETKKPQYRVFCRMSWMQKDRAEVTGFGAVNA